jgi:cob(I)alamin adenosyltransferase
MSRVKIYTKTGDGGKSSLFNGERRPKSDPIFDALGNVDELNAQLGLCFEHAVLSQHHELSTTLTTIQSTLLDLGSHIATPKTSEASDEKRLERAKFNATSLLSMLETQIDAMDSELPPLRNFILPSGGLTSAHLHVARAVCRRAERSIVPLLEQGDVDEDAFKYINRLSDYFFQAARYAAFKEGKQETPYKKAREASSEPL